MAKCLKMNSAVVKDPSSQLPETLAPGNLTSSFGICRNLKTDEHKDAQTCKHTHDFKNNNKTFF